MNTKHLLLTSSLLAGVALQGAIITFDSVADFTGNFAGSTGFAEVATGGLSGSGAVSLGSDSSIAVYQTGFDASNLSGATFSSYFQYNGADGDGGTGRGFAVGFTSGNADTYSNSSTTTGTDLRVVLDGLGTGDNYGVNLFNNGSAFVTSSKNVTLVNGNWYKIVLSIGGVSGGSYTGITGELFSSDAAGNLGASLKFLNGSGSGLTEASALTSDTEAFGFFGGQNPSDRISGLADNFEVSAVPEPSTFALIGGLLALGLVIIRRRHS